MKASPRARCDAEQQARTEILRASFTASHKARRAITRAMLRIASECRTVSSSGSCCRCVSFVSFVWRGGRTIKSRTKTQACEQHGRTHHTIARSSLALSTATLMQASTRINAFPRGPNWTDVRYARPETTDGRCMQRVSHNGSREIIIWTVSVICRCVVSSVVVVRGERHGGVCIGVWFPVVVGVWFPVGATCVEQ